MHGNYGRRMYGPATKDHVEIGKDAGSSMGRPPLEAREAPNSAAGRNHAIRDVEPVLDEVVAGAYSVNDRK